jgi:hypothetical protein
MMLKLLALLIAASAPALPPQPAVRPAGMPAGVLKLSPCVATMGEHWANPRSMPFGPIYGVYNGKIVFTEVMIDLHAFYVPHAVHDAYCPHGVPNPEAP